MKKAFAQCANAFLSEIFAFKHFSQGVKKDFG